MKKLLKVLKGGVELDQMILPQSQVGWVKQKFFVFF